MSTYHVHPGGSDAAAGSEGSPWRTIGKANTAARPGDLVLIESGRYDQAPRANGVVFRSRHMNPGSVIVTGPARGADAMRVVNIKYEGALDLGPGDDANSFIRCSFRGCTINGGATSAPRANLFLLCNFDDGTMYCHHFGGDRDPAPHITANQWRACTMRFTRPAGEKRVLWRWSGMEANSVTGCKIVLEHPDDGLNDFGDAGAGKIFNSHNNRFSGNVWTCRWPYGINDGTGPGFQLRDDASYNEFERETWLVESDIWWTPNTAGTWVCSCKGNTYRDCMWKVRGNMYFYQCKPAASDVWENCHVRVGGRFDWYNAPPDMPGVTKRGYGEP